MMTKDEARERLLTLLQPGATVYTVLRHVSSSGMSRRIDCYTIQNNRTLYLSGYMEALGIAKRQKGKDGLMVSGCGMDMGYHLVDRLSWALFSKAYTLTHEWI